MCNKQGNIKPRIIFLCSFCLLGLLLFYVYSIHDFLAINRPLNGQVLIVESWFPNAPGMADAAEAVRRGHYSNIICVAVDPPDAVPNQTISNTRLASERLVALGVDASLIQVLTLAAVKQDRTFHCALAVREWLKQNKPHVTAIDVFTAGIHARKSQILYQKALPPEIQVGIIAGRETAYPYTHWWFSRHGIYLIVRNTVGYLYALQQHSVPR